MRKECSGFQEMQVWTFMWLQTQRLGLQLRGRTLTGIYKALLRSIPEPRRPHLCTSGTGLVRFEMNNG